MSITYSQDRKLGCFTAVPLGDALGAPFEFDKKKAPAFDGFMPSFPHKRTNAHGFLVQHQIGQVTDDAELTTCLMRNVVKGYKLVDTLRDYHEWANSRTFSLGTNTRALLKDYAAANLFKQYKKRFVERFPDAVAADRAQSNGFLMRGSPLALITDATLRRNIAKADAFLTNPSSISAEVVVIYTDLLAHLLAIPDGRHADVAAFLAGYTNLNPAIQQAIDDASDPAFPRLVYAPPGAPDGTPGGGWCVHSLAISLWAVQHAPNFGDGMRDVIRRGGDTDTNAAIAGALLGARFGRAAMDADHVTAANIKAVLECEPAITNGFQSRGIKTEPRPDKYHPMRLIELASIDEAVVTALNKPVDARAFVDGLQLPTPIVRKPVAKRKHLDEPGKVVLITGWSQSGKSTLANALPSELGKEKVKVIHQDSFRNHSSVPTKNPQYGGKRSWEGPQFTDWDKLHAAVAEARSTYKLVIVEGYLLLEDAKLREIATLIIECGVAASVAAQRRTSFPKEWPTAERYYMLCVWPAAVQHEGRIADWKATGSVPLHKLCAGGELGARVQRALALLQPLCGGGA